MIKVAILGFGNVARHLYAAFLSTPEIEIVQIYNRSKGMITLEIETDFTSDLSEIIEADVYIIAIPDDGINDFSEKLPFHNRLVVHTSGGVEMEVLSEKNSKGVFYPLQTFSKESAVDLTTVPICLEASNTSDLKTLKKLANCISEKVVEISSEDRQKLHLAAVFINNFTNHLYHISEEIVTENNLDFDLLKPLIMETAKKVKILSPGEAQTGPAKRNDKKTIEKHLDLLNNDQYREIYKIITKSIQQAHGKKL
jgi:predicted short-subunit dehydrogenase-like oxidoreductase (DUF2520 family)